VSSAPKRLLSDTRPCGIRRDGRWQFTVDLVAARRFLLHMTRWRAGASAPMLESLPPGLEQPLRQLSLPLLHRFIEKLLVSKRQLLSTANPNRQLLLEELLLDWGALLRASARQASGQR
jgi:hypothetical protein